MYERSSEIGRQESEREGKGGEEREKERERERERGGTDTITQYNNNMHEYVETVYKYVVYKQNNSTVAIHWRIVTRKCTCTVHAVHIHVHVHCTYLFVHTTFPLQVSQGCVSTGKVDPFRPKYMLCAISHTNDPILSHAHVHVRYYYVLYVHVHVNTCL